MTMTTIEAEACTGLIDWDADPTTTTDPLKTCGAIHPVLNPHTGLYILVPWYCKNPHDCENCADVKKYHNKLEILALYEKGNMRVVFHDDSTSAMNKKYGINQVKHYPQPDGTLISVVETTEQVGKALTLAMVDELAQKSIPPRDKRVSGKLKALPAVPPTPKEDDPPLLEDKVEKVECHVVKIIDNEGNILDKKTLSQLEKKVIEATQDLDPKTPSEVQEAVNQVQDMMVLISAQEGYETLFLYVETKYVYPQKIDWSQRKKWLESLPKSP